MIDHIHALPEGYQIQEYTITGVLGFGGFGITYSARDNNLDKIVAIKEYLPSDLAARVDGSTVSAKSQQDKDSYDWGLDRFLDEARTVAKFNHPNIIRIYRFFEQNGTGYIVMDFVEGKTLQEELNEKETLSESEIRKWLWPLMKGLKIVHSSGYLHRDIKPQNIMMGADGIPILLDFGAARMAVGGRTQSLTSIMTPGYAPLEQYASHGKQGPWTDIYALGAVIYRCISGKKPLDAMDRAIADTLESPDSDSIRTYSSGFLSGVKTALKADANQRPQTLEAWLKILDAPEEAATRLMPGTAPPAKPISEPTRVMPKQPKRKPRFLRPLLIGLPILFAIAAIGYWAISQTPEPAEPRQEIAADLGQKAEPEVDTPVQDERQNLVTPEPVEEPVYEGIKIDSTPQGARIYLEGELVGITPARYMDIERGGTATVRLEIEGHEPIEQVVNAPNEGMGEVSFTLQKKIPKYALTIETEPLDARVRILNIQPRYQPGILLEPGQYNVEISKDQYVTHARWIDIIDRPVKQNVKLEMRAYKLTIDASPYDAQIELVDPKRDYTDGIVLPIGRYHYEVHHPDYKDYKGTVTISNHDVLETVELHRIAKPPELEIVVTDIIGSAMQRISVLVDGRSVGYMEPDNISFLRKAVGSYKRPIKYGSTFQLSPGSHTIELIYGKASEDSARYTFDSNTGYLMEATVSKWMRKIEIVGFTSSPN